MDNRLNVEIIFDNGNKYVGNILINEESIRTDNIKTDNNNIINLKYGSGKIINNYDKNINFSTFFINGLGEMTYSDGNIYYGIWRNDLRDVVGKFTFSNGTIYEGGWMDDKKNGDGKITYLNGNIFEGKWVNDLRHGKSTMTFSNGDINSYEWDNGKLLNVVKIYNKKPFELSSVEIRKQKYSDCWAHGCSRNFVRTLQILDVIKLKYIEQFYDLFYTILTTDSDCNSGKSYLELIRLLNYLKDNYKDRIFTIKYNESKCKYYDDEEKLEENILKMTINDKNDFICNLKYLFDNNLLFIGNYYYRINLAGNNKPSIAIKTMLYYKLQPYVTIKINKYLINNLKIYSINIPTIPDAKKYDSRCIEQETFGHGVNLRRWTSRAVEFKNSWGKTISYNGNFSVTDLKYITCIKDITKNYTNFISLMFDYNNLNNKYKNIVNTKLSKYWNTFDDSLSVEEANYYLGEYNIYGLFHGKGRITYYDNFTYDGNWKNGLRDGFGTYFDISNNIMYRGEWKDDKREGKGIKYFPDGNFYDGEWKNGFRDGYGKLFNKDNNIIYEGEWKNNEQEGFGKMNFCDFFYEGNWKKGFRDGFGKLFSKDNNIIYDGQWKDNLQDGIGKIIYPRGEYYVGEFKKNLKDGNGTLFNKDNKIIYKGEWKDDKKEGKGEMYFLNKDIYIGDWKNNLEEGSGIKTYNNNLIYKGMWKKGQRNGQGILTNSINNNIIYEGEWENDIQKEIEMTNLKKKYLKYKLKYLNKNKK